MSNLPEGVLHCKKCKQHKAVAEFYENKTRGGYSKFCKTCTAELEPHANGLPEFLECKVCKTTKERAAFRGHRSGGSAPICRVCRAEYVKSHNIDTSKKYRLPYTPIVDGQKVCSGCSRNLDVSMFSKNLSAPHGLEWKCRDCRKSARVAYMATVPDSYWEIRRHNRHIYGDLSVEFIKKMYEESGGCYYCGIAFGSPKDAVLDHKHPRSKGGKPVAENVVFACDQCHRAKNDMSESDFKEWIKALAARVVSEKIPSGQELELASFGDAVNKPGSIQQRSA